MDRRLTKDVLNQDLDGTQRHIPERDAIQRPFLPVLWVDNAEEIL